jgi:Ni/Fe-hydrogenase subunit HybB-like protein
MTLPIRLTRWDWFLLLVMGVALVVTAVRFVGGIGSVANINNAYPWGWWVGYGVMTMVAFGGVGFTITLLVEVFGRQRYHSFLRPAVLMAMLFYIAAITMLMVELGRPWKVWMILVSWAPTSPLFEVGWCAFLYLNVLIFEFAQVPMEQRGWKRALEISRKVYIPLMLLGATLSHLHQSSIGSLLTIVPHKVHALWWSQNLAWLFLASAIMTGPAMAMLEHMAAARWLNFAPRVDLLGGLARIEAWLIGLYATFKISDLFYRGAAGALFEWSWITLSFWTEVFIGLVLPFAMLLQPEVRASRKMLAAACGMVLFGVLLNRLNVAVIGLRVRHWEWYVPSAGEVIITLGITAGIVFVFGALVRLLPIHEEYVPPTPVEKAPARELRPSPVAP